MSRNKGELVGATLAGYEITDFIGEGGSAVVYRAEKDDEVVALKVSHPRLVTNRTASARFLREVKAIQRVSHPGIVEILDWGIADDRIFIAMELVDAKDLSTVLQNEGSFSEARAVSIAIAVCEVLEAAHDLGVIHRDLKPRNIKLLEPKDGREQVKLMDFGLAKIFHPELGPEEDDEDEETHVETLTSPSTVLGTPKYMAPELYGGHDEVDGRTDVYSLGVIMYRMLTGRMPYSGRDALQLMMSVATSTAPPPSQVSAGLDGELDAIVLRCIEKQVGDRFDSAADLREALSEIVDRLEEAEHNKPTKVYNPIPSSVQAIGDADTRLGDTHVYDKKKKRKKKKKDGIGRVAALDEDGDEPTRTKTTRVMRPDIHKHKKKKKKKKNRVSGVGDTIDLKPGEYPDPESFDELTDDVETVLASSTPSSPRRWRMFAFWAAVALAVAVTLALLR